MARATVGTWAGLTILLAWTTIPAIAEDAPKLVAESEPLTAQEQATKFHLPPGFEIQLVVSEPAIQKPMNLSFDAQGRLWVTQSIEYPYPADPEKQIPRDTLRILSDSDNDGVPDQVSIYADGLNIPIGVTPIHDGALCYSIPDIFHLQDTDGDGKADKRQTYYSEFGHLDTHGMASSFRWWIDGWVYACHGFANDSTVKGADGMPIVMNSGNTYRFRPDGSHIEYHTHGQVNPFGLTFDPWGNVYSSDCHTKPVYMLLRGAWYPSFGKPHDGLGFAPEMIEHLHGSTGIAGIAYYAADQFPEPYRETMFIGNPVTGKINHDRLQQFGSTYKAIELPDFLTCDDPWFRPVDICLAPDGSLYVADFYNRIIGHYEVPLEHPGRDRERGRIWRIVYRGTGDTPVAVDRTPDLTKQSLPELLTCLQSPNLTVRTLATHQLVHRIGSDAVEPVRGLVAGAGDVWQRVHGLWVLHRLDALDDDRVAKLARDPEAIVRVHLMKAIADRPQWSTSGFEQGLAVQLLWDSNALLRRAAADALGRHPDQANVARLLQLWEETPAQDTHLIHVTRMALRDTLASRTDLAGVLAEYSEHPDLQAKLAEVTLGLATSESSAFLLQYLQSRDERPSRLADYLHHAVRYADDATLGQLFEYARGFRQEDPGVQTTVLLSLHRSTQERGGNLPEDVRAWAVEFGRARLTAQDEAAIGAGLIFARELGLKELAEELSHLAGPEAAVEKPRPLAIEVFAAVAPERARGELLQLVKRDDQPMSIRQKAAETLGGVQDDDVRKGLLDTLVVAPSSLATSIARGLARSDQGGDALLSMIELGKASRLLLQDSRVANELLFQEFDRKQERMDALLENLPAADEQIRTMIANRRNRFDPDTADLARGAEIFKRNCSACHQLAGEGGKVGPQLDGVGVRGLERILEDVLDPNRNVDQTFQSTLLSLTDGQVVTGLVLREEGAVVVLADSEGKEQRIAADTIEARRKTALSPMPADIGEKLPAEEFNHLLKFLLSQQQAPSIPSE